MASVNVINNTTVNYVPMTGALEANEAQPVEETSSDLTVSENDTATTPSVPDLDEVDPKVLGRMAELLGVDYEQLIEMLTNENAESNIKAMIETLTKKLDAAKANKAKRMEQAKKFLDFMEKNAKLIERLTKSLSRGFFGTISAAFCLMKLMKELTGERLSFGAALSMAWGLRKAVRDPSRAADIIGKIAEKLESKCERKGISPAASKAFVAMMTGVMSLSVAQASVNRRGVFGWFHHHSVARLEAGYSKADGRENSSYETMARGMLLAALASGGDMDITKMLSTQAEDAEIKELMDMLAQLMLGESETMGDLDQLIADLEMCLETLTGLLGQITDSTKALEGNADLQDSGTMA